MSSPLAIATIKKDEGLRLDAYLCPAQVWTIGYGCTYHLDRRPVKRGDKLASEAEADRLLRAILDRDFMPHLRRIPCWDEMSEGQQAALTSFAWNLGAQFYGSPGFETITGCLINKRWERVPGALKLYVKGRVNGKLVTIQGLVNRREREAQLWQSTTSDPTTSVTMLIPNPPATAIAGQPIVLSGKTSPQYAGQKVEVKAEHHPLGSPLVNADGSFSLTTVLNQPGNRRLSLAIAGQSQLFTLTVYQSEQHRFSLSGSVGVNGTNAVNDVKAVQQRLKDLGYPVGTVDGKVGTNTIAMIRLFQSIIQGRSTVAGDGRVDVNGTTHQWLMAGNAPKWQLMPKSDPKIGYRNRELEETWDNHDYGTSWLADAILAIAADYQKTYRASRPNASEFVINDVSVPHGGNTPDHAGHETGLMCDVFLPRKDGGFSLPTYENANYDRNACRAMLQSIRRHPLFKLAYFNDPTLIGEGLCKRAGGHHHHIHFEIKPPAKKITPQVRR